METEPPFHPSDQRAVDLRRRVHAHPELSSQEHETARVLEEFLVTHRPTSIATGVGGTGLVATYDSGVPGPTVMVRAELDALPITERSGVMHASNSPGVMHACGHDGHLATVAALAHRLERRPPERGRVCLLFQPAEETGAGAQAMLDDPRWGDAGAGLPEPDVCLAYHNLPGEPMGRVVFASPIFSCASTGLSFDLVGLTGHCCSPGYARNPLHALAPILDDLLELPLGLDPDGTPEVVLTHLRSGEDHIYGTSPDGARLNMTLRAVTDGALRELLERAVALVTTHAEAEGLQVSHSLHDTFRASRTDPAVIPVVRAAAEALGMAHETRDAPFRWSEDFGRFTERCPGLLLGIGSGADRPPLHHPTFDFPDALIPVASDLLERAARGLLASDQLGTG
ncbi:MAG: amidohydrolase [Phycisphaerales bacterium JB040]